MLLLFNLDAKLDKEFTSFNSIFKSIVEVIYPLRSQFTDIINAKDTK
mgnify:CR=1 FL=1